MHRPIAPSGMHDTDELQWLGPVWDDASAMVRCLSGGPAPALAQHRGCAGARRASRQCTALPHRAAGFSLDWTLSAMMPLPYGAASWALCSSITWQPQQVETLEQRPTCSCACDAASSPCAEAWDSRGLRTACCFSWAAERHCKQLPAVCGSPCRWRRSWRSTDSQQTHVRCQRLIVCNAVGKLRLRRACCLSCLVWLPPSVTWQPLQVEEALEQYRQ